MNPLTGVCSGPARANANFDIFNCHLSYNPAQQRMEFNMHAPLEPNAYEALVNYDHSCSPPCYLSRAHRDCIPPEMLASHLLLVSLGHAAWPLNPSGITPLNDPDLLLGNR